MNANGEPELGDLCEACGEPLDARDVELCLLRHEGCLTAVVLVVLENGVAR